MRYLRFSVLSRRQKMKIKSVIFFGLKRRDCFGSQNLASRLSVRILVKNITIFIRIFTTPSKKRTTIVIPSCGVRMRRRKNKDPGSVSHSVSPSLGNQITCAGGIAKDIRAKPIIGQNRRFFTELKRKPAGFQRLKYQLKNCSFHFCKSGGQKPADNSRFAFFIINLSLKK